MGGVLLAVSGLAATAREPWTASRVVGSPNPPAPYAVERRHPGQQFQNPVELAFMPGAPRLFVAEQGGKVWSFDTRSNGAARDLVIDLRQHHQPFDNILGFTFHPGFATNRFIFINYNEPGGRPAGAHVSRFTVSSLHPPVIDPTSERIVIRWMSGEHNGCALAFGSDGFLYISTGDSAPPDPPDGKLQTGQDLRDLMASILRIDVDRTEGTNQYAIPRDNPFVNTPGARPEVYAFGLRNPFRMAFDRVTGDLLAADVGFEQWEMIYRVKAGGNYGWPITEGPNLRVRMDVKQGPGPILPPLVAIPHSDGASVTGGQFYRGKKLPKLHGAYLYGDWETGKFWALRHQGDTLISNDELCDTTLQPISFAVDADGEITILDYRGGLHGLVPNVAPAANLAFPRRLSDSGLFSDTARLVAAPGVVTYQPAATMWSDHAAVSHHLGVPGTGRIVTAPTRQTIAGRMWDFPSNTVFARTATLDDAGTPRRVETKLMHFDGQAWSGYSYRWNETQTDADLVPASGTNTVVNLRDATVPGGVRATPWRFSGRAECFRCHNSWASETLSFNWLQLRPEELDRLAKLEVLSVKERPRNVGPLVNPHDSAAALDSRARSWLHVNCAGCHRNGAGGSVAIHLNYDKPPRDWRALDEKPLRGDFGLADARIIAPGDPFRSTLLYRISSEGAGHMPHIGSRLVDEPGLRLVRDWIRSLPAKDADAEPAKRSANIAAALASGDTATLLASMNGALALATSVSNASFRPPPSAVESTNALIRDLFQRFLPPGERRQTLGSDIDPQGILALAGDVARGRELFAGAAQCARCHVAAGVGRAFGPELNDLGRRYDRAQLLDQILNPSKVVAPEFRLLTVTLRDDTELSGFVRRRSATEVVLRDEALTDHTLAISRIKDSHESSLSSMPEGLLASLTAQEAADLVEFLFRSTSTQAKP